MASTGHRSRARTTARDAPDEGESVPEHAPHNVQRTAATRMVEVPVGGTACASEARRFDASYGWWAVAPSSAITRRQRRDRSFVRAASPRRQGRRALPDGCPVGCPLTAGRLVERPVQRRSWSAVRAGGALGGTRSPNLLIRSLVRVARLRPLEVFSLVRRWERFMAIHTGPAWRVHIGYTLPRNRSCVDAQALPERRAERAEELAVVTPDVEHLDRGPVPVGAGRFPQGRPSGCRRLRCREHAGPFEHVPTEEQPAVVEACYELLPVHVPTASSSASTTCSSSPNR